MSLFEDQTYMYRDTFFVFLEHEHRPAADKIQASLAELGDRYETMNVKENDGEFDSLTIRSPYDFSAMDIVYVHGDEVTAQIDELMEEFRTMTLVGDDHEKLKKFRSCNARFDIYHFEQIAEGVTEADSFLDPGGLLLVLEKISGICGGVGLDPQSNTLM